MALRRRWRWKWRRRAEVEVVADVEASASKQHSKVRAAGRRLGMGHRRTASLGYSVLRLQVRRQQRGGGSGPRDGRGGSATAEAEQGGTRVARRDGRGAQHAQHHERRPHAAVCT